MASARTPVIQGVKHYLHVLGQESRDKRRAENGITLARLDYIMHSNVAAATPYIRERPVWNGGEVACHCLAYDGWEQVSGNLISWFIHLLDVLHSPITAEHAMSQ